MFWKEEKKKKKKKDKGLENAWIIGPHWDLRERYDL